MNNRIEFVTSADLVYWNKYGRKLARSFLEHVPSDIPLRLYHEASKEGVPAEEYWGTGEIHFSDLYEKTPLEKFLKVAEVKVKERLGIVPARDPVERLKDPLYHYIWDACTFGRKGMALVDGLLSAGRAGARYLFWVDADVLFRKTLPREVLEELMTDVDIAYFGRHPQHSETGFIGFNLHSQPVRDFAQAYINMWAKETVFDLKDGWMDAHVFDAVRESISELKTRNLSTDFGGHVIASSPLGQYIDHMKGTRKQQGFSPERR